MPQILAVVGSLSLFSAPFSLSLEDLVYEGGLLDFRDYKMLTLEGPDAQAFLNNQTTNNLNLLQNGHFQLNAVLDVSAKLVAFFLVLKDSDKKLRLLVHANLYEALKERLEKYLIAEDVVIKNEDLCAYGVIGNKSRQRFPEGYQGEFAGEDIVLTFAKPKLPEVDEALLFKLLILTGYPVWKKTIHDLELFNNTALADLAYAKDKGCFLGQETVAKIDTRRGAAYKPIILMGPSLADSDSSLKKEQKKLGKLLASVENLNLASLNRESRIEGLKIKLDGQEKAHTVLGLPLWSKEQKASDFYHHGVELFTKGEENEAELYLLKAIDCDPVFEEAYESLGVLYGRQERYEEAIEYMQKLSNLNPKSVMAHTNMSLYFMRVGEIDKAEEQKSQATIKQFQQLGDEAESKRKAEEAERRKREELTKREGMFREVLEIDPDDTLANYGLGEIEREKGNFPEAVKLLKQAIQGKKNYSVAWLALGKTYLHSGNLEEAISTLKEGISIASKNGDLMPANEMQQILSELLARR